MPCSSSPWASSLVGFGLGLLFLGRPLPSLVSGVLMGVLLYGLFDYLLDVPLPMGVLALPEN
jgi:putative tricarboxylic transport membrane protein